MNYLRIHKAGIASSVQDNGRVGTLSIGIPPSGAMDATALLSGQHQLGHHDNEAAIEMAYADFAATLSEAHHAVVTGAPVRLSINQQPVESRGVHRIEAGQTLEIKATNEGVYSYLHLSGGVMTTPQLDSRSTSPREAIGGLDGGFLKDGDILPLSESDGAILAADPQLFIRKSNTVVELRFVAGFQFNDFAKEAIKGLLAGEFTVTTRANRMGVTLNGAQLRSGIASLYSEATCYGAIQVPPDGNPIILLNDRQTVGGYPKPGAVIRSDCLRLAQSRPGQRVRFAMCSLDEADRIGWLEQHYLETRLRVAH